MFTHLLILLNRGQNLYQKLLMSFVMVDVIGKCYKKYLQNPYEWKTM